MSTERNPFGGKNPAGLYVPLSEDEQEVLDRLREGHGFRIEVKDWGWVEDPPFRFGDKRVSFEFKMIFKAPDIPQPLHYLEMSLWTRTGILLFGPKTYSTEYDGQPIMVHAGLEIDMALDISIEQMSAELVKLVKPGAFGLTTRVDNMHLPEEKKKLLHHLKEGEARARQETERRAQAAKSQVQK